MRRRALMFLCIVAGALLQQLLPGWPLFGGMKPPILAALVLHYALRRDNRDMWAATFAAAILQDGLDLGPFGPALVAFPILALVAQRIRTEIFADGLVTQLIFGALLGLFTALTALLVFTATGHRPFLPGAALLRLFGSFWLGMVALPLVSRSVNKLESLVPERRRYGWQ